jgi:hypothetical protein
MFARNAKDLVTGVYLGDENEHPTRSRRKSGVDRLIGKNEFTMIINEMNKNLQDAPFKSQSKAGNQTDKKEYRCADGASDEEASGLCGAPHAFKNWQKCENSRSINEE